MHPELGINNFVISRNMQGAPFLCIHTYVDTDRFLKCLLQMLLVL